MITSNNRKHLGTGKEGSKEGRKVISCFHGVAIDASSMIFKVISVSVQNSQTGLYTSSSQESRLVE